MGQEDLPVRNIRRHHTPFFSRYQYSLCAQNKCHYDICSDQIFITLNIFVENITNICISK
jgi:hypothetical protein